MGGTTFETTATGKTTAEAFAAARQHAQYESGHGGYSGTIAEKHDFVLLDLDAEAGKAIAVLEAKRATLTLGAQRKVAARVKALTAMLATKRWDQLSASEREERHATPILDPARLAIMRARMTEQIRVLRGKRNARERAHAIASTLLDLNDARIDDKWGPAGALPIGKCEWLFFGWASS